MVRPGGVTKGKMQSARVIVVPLQITKEMIAAKQKAAGKTSKLGLAVAGKSESGSKAGSVSVSESSETDKKFITKGKTPAKQLKTGMTFKKKEDSVSEIKALGLKSKTPSKVASKAAKKVAEVESDSECENPDLEFLPAGKTQQVKHHKKKAIEVEKDEDRVKGDDQKQGKDDQCKDSEAEQGGGAKVGKVKKVLRKKDECSEESDDAVGKPKIKQLNRDKSEEDMDSDTENKTKPKAVSAKSKTPKKGSRKSEREEEDEEEDLEAEAKPRVGSAKGNKAKLASQVKDELDAEIKEDGGAEGKQAKNTATEPDSQDLEVKSGDKVKKTKKAKEEEEELYTADSETDEDQKSDSELVKVKKTPGRKRKEKTKEEPVVIVTSARRSKRESNLSVKLAEWGLVPMGKHLLSVTTIWYVSMLN